MAKRLTNWLETHWVNPAYSGWVFGGLSVFFFIAATNTLAGWLYVLSGLGIALLAIAAYLPRQSLRDLQIKRGSIEPVSAGDYLTIELTLTNPTAQVRTLLQLQDHIADQLGSPAQTAIAQLPAHHHHHWIYYYNTAQRGIYRWNQVELRTAAPLGLFWYSRHLDLKAKAIVYPTLLTLSHCPLLDDIGRERDPRFESQNQSLMSSEGITRTLRPYRWGDSTRLIHWRTSARYGELRVREMEVFQGGQEVILCLDTHSLWQDEQPPTGLTSRIETFEQAVIAAASLYFYAGRKSIPIKLWTAATGVIQGNRTVLEALAATQPREPLQVPTPTLEPLLWLTQDSQSIATLPAGSRWILWPRSAAEGQRGADLLQGKESGLRINSTEPLEKQLQATLSPQV
jgi:uncharacterized protein (DUF58 family)